MDKRDKMDYFRIGLLFCVLIAVVIFSVIIFRNAKEIGSHPLQYAADSLGEGTECSCSVPSPTGMSRYDFNKTTVIFYENAYTGITFGDFEVNEK